MNAFYLILVGLAVAMLNSSCVSYMALKHNKEKVYKSEIAKRGNPPEMVRAYAHGDIVGVGFEVTSVDAIFYDFKTFITQFGAALADVALLYGTYETVDQFNDRGGNSSQRNNDVSISGNQNSSISISISGDQQSTTQTDTRNDTSNNNF